jgi:hypothetical protein
MKSRTPKAAQRPTSRDSAAHAAAPRRSAQEAAPRPPRQTTPSATRRPEEAPRSPAGTGATPRAGKPAGAPSAAKEGPLVGRVLGTSLRAAQEHWRNAIVTDGAAGLARGAIAIALRLCVQLLTTWNTPQGRALTRQLFALTDTGRATAALLGVPVVAPAAAAPAPVAQLPAPAPCRIERAGWSLDDLEAALAESRRAFEDMWITVEDLGLPENEQGFAGHVEAARRHAFDFTANMHMAADYIAAMRRDLDGHARRAAPAVDPGRAVVEKGGDQLVAAVTGGKGVDRAA